MWFSSESYAGFWRRLGVESLDVVCVLLLTVALLMGFFPVTGEDEPHDAIVLLALLATAYVYLVVVKWSRLGTVGYRLFRVRLVDAAGQRPGLARAHLRRQGGRGARRPGSSRLQAALRDGDVVRVPGAPAAFHPAHQALSKQASNAIERVTLRRP